VLLLDELERQVLADRHVAAVLMAAGAKDVTLPSLQEQRQLFDAALSAEPTPLTAVDSEQMELRRALGVA
jgi:hypothetical protein